MADISEQTITINGKNYIVAQCVLASRNLKPFKVKLQGFYKNYCAPCSDDLLDFVEHMKRVMDADLSFPVILSPEGVIVDGRHRLIKALLDESETLLVVQLDKMPTPIRNSEE